MLPENLLDLTMSSRKTLTIFTLSLLFLLAGPYKADARLHDVSDQSQNQRLVARDVITLVLGGIKNAKKFVGMIPKLRSVRQSPCSDPLKLLGCVDGLMDNLSNLESILKRLRHLKGPHVAHDARELGRVQGRITGVSGACRGALKDVDGAVIQMLNSNLADVALLVGSVQRAVSGIGVSDVGA